ncbi:MAG: ACT domain-containing protein [Candidatus Nealsonbacteria bacterium]|nr:ACT domain-containing protein [Candidatus Nealsonbacteria bacterium]
MNTKKFTLSTLPEKLGICHFDKKSPIPGWAMDINFCSITRTKDELSVVCPQDKIPGGVLAEKNWRAFKLEGTADLFSVGVIASLSQPLAEAGISLFIVSTYETNYILVEEKNLAKSKEILGSFCEIQAN